MDDVASGTYLPAPNGYLWIALDLCWEEFLADCEYDSPTSYLPVISFFLFSSMPIFYFLSMVPDLYSLSNLILYAYEY